MAQKKTNSPNKSSSSDAVEGTSKWSNGNISYYFVSGSKSDKNSIANEEIIMNRYGSYNKPSLGKIGKISSPLKKDIQDAMKSYELVANIKFSQSKNLASADLKYMAYKFEYDLWMGGTVIGQAQFPGDNPKQGGGHEAYIMMHPDLDVRSGNKKGDTNIYKYLAIHELGHGLGLAHTHDSGGGTQDIDGKALDNIKYSVMSYDYEGADEKKFKYGYNLTPMALDILALQNMYGVNKKAHTGNTTYTLTDSGKANADIDGKDNKISIGASLYCIWDAGGNDTMSYKGKQSSYLNLNDAYLKKPTDFWESIFGIEDPEMSRTRYAVYTELSEVYSVKIPREISDDYWGMRGRETNIYTSQVFDAKTGKVQSGGYSIASGAKIENASGGEQFDIIVGNELNNSLYGNGGNDIIAGGSGNDKLYGGKGDDVLIGGYGNDIFYADIGKDYFDGGLGTDTVNYELLKQSVNIDLGKKIYLGGAKGNKMIDVENLVGTKSNDSLLGDASSNRLEGLGGNDTLSGFDGNDFLYGGAGNDIITGGMGKDNLSGSAGNDKFYYNNIAESVIPTRDIIKDFETKKDKLYFNLDVDKADIIIKTVGNYKTVSIAETNFQIQVNKSIAMTDIVIV